MILNNVSHHQKLIEWSGYNQWRLLYRATRDGKSASNFHNKCDNQGKTIVIIKVKQYVFGGFANCNWKSSGQYIHDTGCWLFSLVNPNNNSPAKFSNTNSSYSMYCGSNYGPTFGGGHDICKLLL